MSGDRYPKRLDIDAPGEVWVKQNSGEDFRQTINAYFGEREIRVRKTAMTIDQTINLAITGGVIRGKGRLSLIQWAGAPNGFLFNMGNGATDLTDIYVEGLRLDGLGVGNGFKYLGGQRQNLHRVMLTNMKQYALLFEGNATVDVEDCTIDLSTLSNSGEAGTSIEAAIRFQAYVYGCKILRNTFVNNNRDIIINAVKEHLIKANNMWGTTAGNRIMLYGANHNRIIANLIADADYDGIRLENSSRNVITGGNDIYGNDKSGTVSRGGIILLGTSNHNTIVGNIVDGKDGGGTPRQKLGIAEQGSADYNVVVGNTVVDNIDNNTVKIGANSDFSHNIIT